MSRVEFEVFDKLPPKAPRRRPEAVMADFAEALRHLPGKWGKWPTLVQSSTARTYACKIRHGQFPAFAAGFDAVFRNESLYVRYLGDEVQP